MATLVFKLFSLTLKTVSKPLANRLNGALLTHPVVRQRLVKVANVRKCFLKGCAHSYSLHHQAATESGAVGVVHLSAISPVDPLEQFMHRVEVRITRGAEGRTGKAFIADMDEEHAMEVISKFITETFLYSVSCWGYASVG